MNNKCWLYHLEIKRYLNGDESAESMRQARDSINEELKKVWFLPPVGWLKYVAMAIEKEDVNLFNLGLEALYDWGDQNRVWLG